jgi:hypothetical protein
VKKRQEEYKQQVVTEWQAVADRQAFQPLIAARALMARQLEPVLNQHAVMLLSPLCGVARMMLRQLPRSHQQAP